MNLESVYMGFRLRTPLVASASPLTATVEGMKLLEEAGVSAVVMPSIFEEQLSGRFHDESWSLKHGIEPYPASLSYLPSKEDYLISPESYLERLREASNVLSIPVIASMSGASPGEWIKFGSRLEVAGADAIELSLYDVPCDMNAAACEVEEAYTRLIGQLRREISIPLAVKVVPFFTSFPHFARRVVENGADALVLFNQLFYANIDIEHGCYSKKFQWSTPGEIDLSLRWISLLSGQLQTSLAATGGAHSGMDVMKLICAGADVVMLCSSLIRNGLSHLGVIEKEMTVWLEEHGHVSLGSLRGHLSMKEFPEAAAFQRANYIWAIAQTAKRESAEAEP